MRKGFTRKPQGGEPATRSKNYITPSGLQRLKDEYRFLLIRERPAVTEVVAWAASNGDRSENADYQYGKRRLRQIGERTKIVSPLWAIRSPIVGPSQDRSRVTTQCLLLPTLSRNPSHQQRSRKSRWGKHGSDLPTTPFRVRPAQVCGGKAAVNSYPTFFRFISLRTCRYVFGMARQEAPSLARLHRLKQQCPVVVVRGGR
jgi:hypothetical protein